MPRRLLAIDLDGTLLMPGGDSADLIAPEDWIALERARRAGVMITIATGRTAAGALAVARALTIAIPLICADGELLVCANRIESFRAAGPNAGQHTKGATLAALAASLGIARADVAAIGDWYNDISMLAWAGRSFAMGQAPGPVRAAATDALEAAWGGGVAEAIARWIPR